MEPRKCTFPVRSPQAAAFGGGNAPLPAEANSSMQAPVQPAKKPILKPNKFIRTLGGRASLGLTPAPGKNRSTALSVRRIGAPRTTQSAGPFDGNKVDARRNGGWETGWPVFRVRAHTNLRQFHRSERRETRRRSIFRRGAPDDADRNAFSFPAGCEIRGRMWAGIRIDGTDRRKGRKGQAQRNRIAERSPRAPGIRAEQQKKGGESSVRAVFGRKAFGIWSPPPATRAAGLRPRFAGRRPLDNPRRRGYYVVIRHIVVRRIDGGAGRIGVCLQSTEAEILR
jgi:hypothetical protein